MSLVNHDCGSNLVFSNIRFQIPHKHFENLEAIGGKVIAEHEITIASGEELTFDYFAQSKEKANFFGHACECKTCTQK
jgi:acetyl/propionyl-CoA carboxylase alpha subunit